MSRVLTALVIAALAYVLAGSPAVPSPAALLPAALVDAVVTPVGRFGIAQFEKNRLPDWLSRWGTRVFLQKGIEEDLALAGPDGSESQSEFFRGFVADLKARPIAEQTKAANEQHYEVDTRFYDLVLGKHRKYSSALYPSADTPVESALELLDEAEDRMLRLYAERARITPRDAFRVMDLGCGWGSVTLWFAEHFPKCEFVGVSNSRTQRKHILSEAKKRGLTNVDVITGDITTFTLPDGVAKFDRVISIEMMEHMKNYEKLLGKISRNFLQPDGLLFVHIFVAKTHPYHFVSNGKPNDWMADHFFSGGTMPSDDLLLHFQKDLALVDRWRVDGRHYSLTLEAWLQQMDKRKVEVRKVLEEVYGADQVVKWTARWRAFFFVCSELFKYNEGKQWFVSHYLFENRQQQ